MKTTQVNAPLKRQTPKAVLVEIDGVDCWFPKKKVTVENDVVLTVSAAMLATKLADAKAVIAERERQRNATVILPLSRIQKETDKGVCILFDAYLSTASACGETGIELWFPKSQIVQENGKINFPEWLLKAKARERADWLNARQLIVYAGDDNCTSVQAYGG